MPSVRKWFKPYDLPFLLLSSILVIAYVLTAGGGFPLDDSWIHQVYGRNLATTGRWEFISGVPSAGSTSPLYTVLLAAGYLIGVPYLLWTHLLGTLALAAAGMIAVRLTERLITLLEPEPRMPTLLPIFAGLSVIVSWHMVWAAVSGMETMLICTFTLALLYTALLEHSPQRTLIYGGLFGALAALAAATRPESILLTGLIGLGVLIARPQGTWRSVIVWSIGAALGFAVLIAPYLLLNLQLTGGLLPNTAAAKQAMAAPTRILFTFPQRFLQMLYSLIAGGQLLLASGMLFFAWRFARALRQNRRAVFGLVPLIWAVGLTALYAERLFAPQQHGRYIIPILPLMLVTGVIGTFWLMRVGRRNRIGRVLSRSLALTALFVFIAYAVIGATVYRADVQIIQQEQVASALWIGQHLPPNALIGIHDIGAVGYFAPRPMLDVAGLITPEVIPIIHDVDALWALLRERGAQYFMGFPDQIPGDNPDQPFLCPIFRSNGTASADAGGPMMVIYALAWDGVCPLETLPRQP